MNAESDHLLLLAAANQQLRINLIEIELTQTDESKPRFFGSGKIEQIEGELVIEMLHEGDGAIIEGISSLEDKLPTYSMKAQDTYGRIWSAEQIKLSFYGNVINETHGRVITGKIYQMKTISTHHNDGMYKSSVTLYLDGQLNFPKNSKRDTGSKVSFQRCQFTLRETCLDLEVICENRTFTQINAKSETHYIDTNEINLFIEAFSIWNGKLSSIVAAEHMLDNKCYLFVISIEKGIDKYGFRNPILFNSSRDYLPYFTDFIDKYIIKVEMPRSNYFNFWLDCVQTSRNDMRVPALAVTTAIESLLKEYFTKFSIVDQDLISQYESIKAELEGNIELKRQIDSGTLKNFDKLVIKQIGAAIKKLRNATPTRIMEGLIKNNLLNICEKEAWESLRHKTAHGNRLKLPMDDEILSENDYQDLNICVGLFLKLLLIGIGYTGKIVDYTKTYSNSRDIRKNISEVSVDYHSIEL